MRLKLLFIALLFSLTFFPLLAFGKTNATPAPFKQAPVQFRNDIFNPYWWLAIPTALRNDIFDPIWYMKVASHFTNDIFNKGLWWSGYEPPQFILPQPTPTAAPKSTPKITPKYAPTPKPKSTPIPIPVSIPTPKPTSSKECGTNECNFDVYCTAFGQGGCWRCDCNRCSTDPGLYQACN